MNIQSLFDLMSDIGQRHRAATQMTLGKLIAELEGMPPGAKVINMSRPHSYRGYYCDLAFERSEGTRPASDLLAECKAIVGNDLEDIRAANT